jgi:Zn-dependent metalloprotease
VYDEATRRRAREERYVSSISRRPLTGGLVVSLIVATTLAALHPAVEGQVPAPGRRMIGSPADPGQTLAVLQEDARTGRATFAARQGQSQGLALGLPAGMSATARALAFVDRHGAAFGLARRADAAVAGPPTVDALGIEHVRLRQLHQGVPVAGAELLVHLSGDRVVGANGEIVDRLPASVRPGLAAGAAAETARLLIDKHQPGLAGTASYSPPRLEVFNRGVFDDADVPSRLAWFVVASSPSLREYIWVDADTNDVLLNFSQVTSARSRSVYTASGGSTLPGTLVRSEGQAATGDADQDNAYAYSGHTYDFFFSFFGLDSFNATGGTLISTAHYCSGGCPFVNAFWNGLQAVFGEGFASADDIVAHEFTHGVIDYSADLFYYAQSGALNESYADIFGETIDLTNGAGNDTPGVRWRIGEDLAVPYLRDMMTPTQRGDPGKMSDPELRCAPQGWTDATADKGGVHHNSGIANHAYALMVDGGTYNGETIAGLGLTKAARIQYRALTTYLTSGSGFLNNDIALRQACSDLIGSAGITFGDCDQVAAALDAVEMSQNLACTNASAAPALCAAGGVPVNVFLDTFETGGANTNWEAPTSSPTRWGVTTEFASGAAWSAFGPDTTGVSDHQLTRASAVTVPANGRLYFDHAFEFENDGSPTGSAFDGGVIEYSVNSGGTWLDAGGFVEAGQGYAGTIGSSFQNPLGGRQAYVRSSYGYTGTRLNLSSLAGQNVLIRFRIGSDVLFGALGWLVDNVRVYSCQTTMTANPAALDFGAVKDGAGGAILDVTPAQAVTVGYAGGGAAPGWTASANQTWVSISPASGTGFGVFDVSIVNPGNVIGGATSLNATVTVSAPGAAPAQVAVHLAVQQSPGASAPAFGQIDAPAQGATGIVGAVGVSGWALDDIGVQDVTVYRNCLAFDNPASCQLIAGHNVVLLGTAAFLAGARPDVAVAFPGFPNRDRAGWGIQILSNMLPHVANAQVYGGQGSISFYAFATDLEGHVTLLGRSVPDHTPTTVTMDNDNIAKPFGTIDTPGQGQVVGGMLANFGWALTPETDTVAGNGNDIEIPTNGSTMFVFVDGAPVGNVAYNQCRGTVGNPVPGGLFCNDDVASIFGNTSPQPGGTTRTSNPTRYRNLDAGRGAIGAFLIDTGGLANGLHTIAWSVTDSQGRIEGIGSRFFTVMNAGAPAPAPTFAAMLARPAAAYGDADALPHMAAGRPQVAATLGFEAAAPSRLAAGPGVPPRVTVPAGGRLEVQLGSPVDDGYLLAGRTMAALPVGANLDRSRGVFTWNPAPGYLGTFELAFVTTRGRIPVFVTVAAAR